MQQKVTSKNAKPQTQISKQKQTKMCLYPKQQQQIFPFVPKFNLQLEKRRKKTEGHTVGPPGETLCGRHSGALISNPSERHCY